MRIFGQDHRQPKRFLPGTRRTRTPGDTLKDFGRHMPEVGITRLANVTGLDSIGIPVVQAVRPNSRSLSVSQGKGVDVDSAKASAMMEAIELWHAEHIDLPCRSASYRSLRKTETVIDLERISMIKGAKLRMDEQRSWLRGWDLLKQEAVWVPLEVISMNTIGVLQARMTFMATSNGLASGNHILEAIDHALCEVIERDTHALYWATGTKGALKSKVAIESITDPSLMALIARCVAADMDIAIFEMDSDVGVPTFCVGLVEREDLAQWRRMGIQWGCGTHLSPVIALSRAITEAAQARLTVIAGSRDDNPPATYATTQEVETVQRFRDTAFAAPSMRPFPTTTRLEEADTFEGDVEIMLEAVRAVGADSAIVVDLSKDHIGIPVVKVIVPGLEGAPFTPGYVEGERARRAREAHS